MQGFLVASEGVAAGGVFRVFFYSQVEGSTPPVRFLARIDLSDDLDPETDGEGGGAGPRDDVRRLVAEFKCDDPSLLTGFVRRLQLKRHFHMVTV